MAGKDSVVSHEPAEPGIWMLPSLLPLSLTFSLSLDVSLLCANFFFPSHWTRLSPCGRTYDHSQFQSFISQVHHRIGLSPTHYSSHPKKQVNNPRSAWVEQRGLVAQPWSHQQVLGSGVGQKTIWLQREDEQFPEELFFQKSGGGW